MKTLLILNIVILCMIILSFIIIYTRNQIKQKIEVKFKQAEAMKKEYEKKLNSRRPTPSIDYATLMGIVDQCIDMEFRVSYLTDLSLTNKVIISDFEGDLKQLAKGVIDAFSVELLEDLLYFHPSEYLVSYVARILKLKLMAYVKEHKIGIK